MNATRARQLSIERASMMADFTNRIRSACEEEFPIGARVKWVHTFDRNGNPKYRRGVVSDHRMFDVEITSKSGAIHHQRPEFVMADEADGVK